MSPAATADASVIFRMQGITKRFRGTVAVSDVDFALCPGEVHALVGENGAGKSTLMKVVAGVHAPDEGIYEVGGQRAQFSSPRDAEKAGIAMIPQEPNLFPELSVAENLYVGRRRPRNRWGGLDWAAMRDEARAWLDTLGVTLDGGTPVKQLSTANRQVVAIARALMGRARAVVMDEPTSSLTGREVERLVGIVADLTSQGVGVVYVSHRLGEVFEVADRITVLRDGERIATEPACELDAAELVRLMVGRPLNQLFTRTRDGVGDVALELRGLTRPGEFADVDLTVRRGEVVGLAGLVGAGRTELAQSIFGLRSAAAGEVYVNGTRTSLGSTKAAMRQGVFYVPEDRQSQGLILPFPVGPNVTLSVLDRFSRFGFVRFGAERAVAERFTENLAIRGVDVSSPVSRLSGGNQQKVVIAKALVRDPSILLLDEPTRGVDVGAKSEIYRLIDELAGQGKAILFISSELEELVSMADRIVVMREGRVAGEFDRDEVSQERVMAAATGTEVAGPTGSTWESG